MEAEKVVVAEGGTAAAGEAAAAPAPEKEKKARGKPKDPHAPPKPVMPFYAFSAKLRPELKENCPELALDMNAMRDRIKDDWEKKPQEEKDRLQAEFDKEMAIWKPKWAAYKETKEYRKWYDEKMDWYDGKVRRKFLKSLNEEVHKFKPPAEDTPTGDIGLTLDENGKISEVKEGSMAAASGVKVGWTIIAINKKKDIGFKMDIFKQQQDGVKDEATGKYLKFTLTFDKGAPKKPKSGYMLFAGDVRMRITKEVLDAGGQNFEVGGKISEEWQALSPAQQAEYGEKSAKMKEKYLAEMEVFTKTEAYGTFKDKQANLEAKQKLGSLTRKKLDDAPKKTLSPYGLYKAEMMPKLEEAEENKGMTPRELGRKCADMWTALSEEAKGKYVEDGAKQKEEYQVKLLKFKAETKYTEFLVQRQQVKSRENRLIGLREMPKKPKSVFALYAQDHKHEVPAGKGEGKGIHALKQKFAAIAEEQRKQYEAQEKESKAKFAAELEVFKKSPKFGAYQKKEQRIKMEFLNEAMKVMTLKWLSAAPPEPPRTPFAVYLAEKRKADGEGSGAPKDKKARLEEVAKYKVEFGKLGKDTKTEYDNQRKEKLKEWQEQCKAFMAQPRWNEYVSEAKRLKVPVQNLLGQKKAVIKTLKNGMQVVPLPERPDSFPKKAPAAFNIFTKEKKEENVPVAEIEGMWKKLDQEAQKKYKDEAAELAKQYEIDVKEFKASDVGKTYLKELAIAVKKKRITEARFKYLKDVPKAPLGALQEFMKEKVKDAKKENPTKSGNELKMVLTGMWKALDASERERLEAAAREKFKAYEDALKAFKQSDNWKAFQRASGGTSSKAKGKGKAKPKAKGKAAGPPPPKAPESMPKKPLNPMQEFAKDNPGKKLGDIAKLFAQQSDDEKKKRAQEANERQQQYTKDYAEFEKSAEGRKYLAAKRAYDRRTMLTNAKQRFLKNEPKKPSPAALIFAGEKRKEVQENNPSLKLGGITSKCMELWKALGAEEKQKYLDQEKEEREKYNTDMAEFKKSVDYRRYAAVENKFRFGAVKKVGAKAKAKTIVAPGPPKPENYPKAPPKALNLFLDEEKEKGEKNVAVLHKRWIDLGAEGQKKFKQIEAEKQQEYQKALKEFNDSADGKKYNRLKAAAEINLRKSRLKANLSKELGSSGVKEPKRPPSAYFVFVSQNQPKVQALSMTERAKELSSMWKNLDAEEKKKYEAQAAEKLKAYEEELAAYNANPAVQRFKRAMTASKPKPAPKPPVKPAAPKPAPGAAGRGRGAAAPKAKATAKAADSDSDVMGSDSSSSSSSDSD